MSQSGFQDALRDPVIFLGDLKGHCVVVIDFRSQYCFRSHSLIFLNCIVLVAQLEGKLNLIHHGGGFTYSMESDETPRLRQCHGFGVGPSLLCRDRRTV